jgi:hypothetical protein
MFVGHYGIAFGAKPAAPFVPLWVYFIAVQWLDVVWSILVLLGIEKLRIVPGITEANAYDLYYMPYTHSLPAGAVATIRRNRRDACCGEPGHSLRRCIAGGFLPLDARSPRAYSRSSAL